MAQELADLRGERDGVPPVMLSPPLCRLLLLKSGGSLQRTTPTNRSRLGRPTGAAMGGRVEGKHGRRGTNATGRNGNTAHALPVGSPSVETPATVRNDHGCGRYRRSNKSIIIQQQQGRAMERFRQKLMTEVGPSVRFDLPHPPLIPTWPPSCKFCTRAPICTFRAAPNLVAIISCTTERVRSVTPLRGCAWLWKHKTINTVSAPLGVRFGRLCPMPQHGRQVGLTSDCDTRRVHDWRGRPRLVSSGDCGFGTGENCGHDLPTTTKDHGTANPEPSQEISWPLFHS